MNTFLWLLKREYWENRGGFKWAPTIAGGVVLLVIAMALLTAEMTVRRHDIKVSQIHLSALANHLSPDQMADVTAAINLGLFGVSFPIAMVLGIVLFFYLLNSLYDERRDRSILFWKSLPVSDTEVVLSKVFMATLVAPLMATVAAIALIFGLLLVLTIFVAIHGGTQAIGTLWTAAEPFSVSAKLLMLIPLNALWALPTIGWLMLCSAFARRVPFLWAVLVPVGVGTTIALFKLMYSFEIPNYWYWKHIVSRILFSVMPGQWLDDSNMERFENADGPKDWIKALDSSAITDLLSSPNLWLGVLAGAAMIVGAIWMRRWRDEG
ncbi:hypothetical protein [Tahibacter amnicola]|uniref:ABC-2 type transport system permease protein n=1 Tax=Tahibacter amnicola TaxID=2976241 RepID=A0ABY6BPR4_9GAMM|nr:hypothetical protein [Tahibacter amnicola]UXI70405.1 hypothetical protein N4264_12445 [Tahibacter amnicola]